MSGYAVLKGASYTLAHTPDMVLHNGTTQTTERIVNPENPFEIGPFQWTSVNFKRLHYNH